MTSCYKLPLNFDPQSLKADLDQISSDEWVAHFNKDYFEGQWTGVALRSVGGLVDKLYPEPHTNKPYADTPLLDRCPRVREVLALFHCPIRSVRLLRLAPGSIIREHRDYDLGYKEGLVRLHIPVITNSEVVFFLDAHRIEIREGECWYLDLGLPHWVENRGPTDRVHLVIDCELNDWLRELIPNPEISESGEEYLSDPKEFERFREVVWNDLALQNRLRQTADRESFIRLVVDLGKERNYRFNYTDVEEALRAAQQVWIERWID